MTRLSISDMLRKLSAKLHDNDIRGKLVITAGMLLYIIFNMFVTGPLIQQAVQNASLAASQSGRWLYYINSLAFVNAEILTSILMLAIFLCMQLIMFTLIIVAIDLIRQIPINRSAACTLAISALVLLMIGALMLN